MGQSSAPGGPDLEQGVAASALADGSCIVGHAHGEAVMLAREGERVYATGATCSHYGGPLGEGLIAAGTVRCPWHHACFDLATGESVGAPGLSPIACFVVERDGDRLRVGARREPLRRRPPARPPSSVLIVGAGAAGTVCAETLRREGYEGPVTLVGAERGGPVDRPNLSKDYLAGTAPEEWMPLRTAEALRQQTIDLIESDAAVALDAAARSVRLTSGRTLAAEALVLATGAEPIRLPIPGAELPHVHVLRTLDDARAIIAGLGGARRAVVIGASFIGLEAAASLRRRGLEVTVVAPEAVPLERVLGAEVGRFVRGVHERAGVQFRLGLKPARITAEAVTLSDGAVVPAELVVMGVGVRPRLALAEAAGLRVDGGIVVNDDLETSAPGVYAAGDVARYPYGGALVRIEHWAVAERHGQAIARTLVGRRPAPRSVPFFWSQHHEVTLSYVGHAERFDHAEVLGDLAAGQATVVYRLAGRVLAVATVGRDRQSLAVERALELGDEAALEQAIAG